MSVHGFFFSFFLDPQKQRAFRNDPLPHTQGSWWNEKAPFAYKKTSPGDKGFKFPTRFFSRRKVPRTGEHRQIAAALARTVYVFQQGCSTAHGGGSFWWFISDSFHYQFLVRPRPPPRSNFNPIHVWQSGIFSIVFRDRFCSLLRACFVRLALFVPTHRVSAKNLSGFQQEDTTQDEGRKTACFNSSSGHGSPCLLVEHSRAQAHSGFALEK